jgi:hypothetical protein
MLGALIWGGLAVVFGFVVVVPFAAAAAVSGRIGRAALGLVAFVAVVSVSQPAAAGPAPFGGTQLGLSGASVTCTPGASLVYVFDYADWSFPEGECPSSGGYVCGTLGIVPSSGNNVAWHGAGKCWELVTGGGDGGGGSAVSLKPFDLSTEDGLAISGAILALWCSAWAIRAVIDTLRDRQDAD